VVFPLDKGRATVVLDKTEYEEKVQHMLDVERTYERMKDPMAVYKRKLVFILSWLKDEEKIGCELNALLFLTSEKVSQLYCLRKVHKAPPFRPTVDYIGSIGYSTCASLWTF